jgi:S-adenosyl-L-methionine hydrolase (adenosine-forming)
MTGLRAAKVPAKHTLAVAGRPLVRARTFSDLPQGTPFWYENAHGLAEIAVNRGSAANVLGLGVGSAIAVSRQD